MNDPSYLDHHANKPNVANKVIQINDIEEPVKLTILADIERDQRLEQFKESLKRSRNEALAEHEVNENKRKADHQAFDQYVKNTSKEKSELKMKYGLKCLEFLKLQRDYDALNEKYTNANITIHGNVFENNRLTTLLAMKNKEIADLNETLQLYTPQSPPDDVALANIMDPPELDLQQSNTVTDFYDFTYSENPFIGLDQDNEPFRAFPSNKLAQTQPEQRVYAKKISPVVTDPKVLYALKLMASSVYSYSRDPFKGMDIEGVRYAFYYGKINKGGLVGMCTNIVLSSDLKVYNISNVDAIMEMSWNDDRSNKGKRGFGHIYLGTMTGGKAFETNLKDVFQTELGLFI